MENYRRNLIVSGKADRTVQSYYRSVRQLMEHYRCDPAVLTQAQVRDYLLHCREVKKWNRWTLKIALTALKFFYEHGEGTEWGIWNFAKPPRYKPEIVVLTPLEVHWLIAAIEAGHLRVCVATMATCGLRVGEVVKLAPADLAQRAGYLLVRAGKGQKDRYVPLPESLREALRGHWRTHRNCSLLFPGGRGRAAAVLQTTRTPMSVGAIQRIVRLAAEAAALRKEVTPHTLRHSYATNMLDAGINVRVLAAYLGHENLETTLRYLHLTPSAQEKGRALAERMIFI